MPRSLGDAAVSARFLIKSLHLEAAREFEVSRQLLADTYELAELRRLSRTLDLLRDRELALQAGEPSAAWTHVALHRLVCEEDGLCQAARYPCVWSGYIQDL